MPDRAGFEAFYGAHLPRIVRACTLVLLDRGEASEDIYREQPEMLLYILDSIRVEKI